MFQRIIEKINSIIEKRKFIEKFGLEPTYGQLIEAWCEDPEKYFFGYYDQALEWKVHPNSSDYSESSFPNISSRFDEQGYRLTFGWIEGISMRNGTVRINHFALDDRLTRRKLGLVFFNAILNFFKSKNAVIIEFHEIHSTNIEHYRRFFEKTGVDEAERGVWRVSLHGKLSDSI